MSDATREAQLIALTAKALRPIAADLGITGTSRMIKADIVSAILRAEATVALLSVGEVHAPTRSDFLMSQSYDRIKSERVERDHAEALDLNRVWDFAAKKLGLIDEPKFAAGDRFRIEVGGQWSEVELIDLDPSGGPGFAWSVRITADKVGVENVPVSFHVLTLTEDFLSNDYVTKIAAPKLLPTAVRRTRRGTLETVVVEDVRDGKVFYRHMDHGRLSSVTYRMREASFTAQFTPVS